MRLARKHPGHAIKQSWRVMLITAVCALLAAGCSHKSHVTKPDNPYGLPNVGDWGFGCLINGRTWIAKDDAPIALIAQEHGDTSIGITGERAGMYSEIVSIGVNPSAPGFKVGAPLPTNQFNQFEYISDSTCQGPYYNDYGGYAISGTITILEIDTVNHVFSGTFSGTIPLPFCDTLKITEGRFKDNYSAM